VLRFDRLLSIAEAAAPTAIDAPQPDGYNWFQSWAATLVALRQEAVEAMSVSVDESATVQVSQASAEQLAQAEERLEYWIEQCQELLAGPDVAAPASPTDDRFEPEAAWSHWVADGGDDQLTIDYIPPASRPRKAVMIGLLGVVGVALAAATLTRQRGAWDVLYQWPAGFGFLIGICWWAWLRPSWFGILLATTCLVLAWRSGWPRPWLRTDGSTVRRGSRA
jgi:hypothetical protein